MLEWFGYTLGQEDAAEHKQVGPTGASLLFFGVK